MSGQQDDNLHVLSDPDPKIIRAHLERFFRRVPSEYPGGMMELAWSETTGAIRYAEWFQCTPEGIEQAVKLAVGKNKEGRNVYVGVNPRRPGVMPGGRSNTADIEIAFFQFVECDKNESNDLLTRASLPCSFSVTTGRTPHRRPHCYWELEDPIRNMDAWKAQQAALRDYFLGDNMTDPPRLMRLAGTINYPAAHKRARGYKQELVTLKTIYGNEERPPVTSQSLAAHYMRGRPQEPRYDQETGEVFDGLNLPRPDFDFQKCIDEIKAGRNLHINSLRMVASLVSKGYATLIIYEFLTGLLLPVSDGGTLGKVSYFIETARRKFGRPDPGIEFEISDGGDIELPAVGVLVPSGRRPRDWLVPYRMMRRHITMTTAAPGVGKSTLAIEEAVSQASGVDFLGFGVKDPCRVAIINNEETRDELERRIEATCQHFEIPFISIAENLFLYSGVDADKIIMSRIDRNKNVIPTIHSIRLRELVNDLKLDVVVLDPFVQMHYVTESSNEEISRTLVTMRSIGTGDHPAAIHVVHHNRKAIAGSSHQAGDISSARGASSMGGEAHFFFTLTDMNDADGENLNIPDHDRVNFLRLDDAKRKMAPAQGARWFQRYGEMMPYGLMGEEVGVLIPYDMDTDKPHVNVSMATKVLMLVDEAWTRGNPFNLSPRTPERYIVKVIMKEMAMTRTNAKRLTDEWLANGIIVNMLRDSHSNSRGFKVVKWPG